jgi:hypothetical protein
MESLVAMCSNRGANLEEISKKLVEVLVSVNICYIIEIRISSSNASNCNGKISSKKRCGG